MLDKSRHLLWNKPGNPNPGSTRKNSINTREDLGKWIVEHHSNCSRQKIILLHLWKQISFESFLSQQGKAYTVTNTHTDRDRSTIKNPNTISTLTFQNKTNNNNNTTIHLSSKST
ncbi:hypothetical protein Ahia01_001419200 [Argonauta hians]